MDLPWYGPIIISVVTFGISLLIWKLLKTNWGHSLVLSYVFASITFVISRPFRADNCNYEVDNVTIVETTMVITSAILSVVLNVYQGCRANPRGQCCMCCRVKKDLSAPVRYDDAMFPPEEKEDLITA